MAPCRRQRLVRPALLFEARAAVDGARPSARAHAAETLCAGVHPNDGENGWRRPERLAIISESAPRAVTSLALSNRSLIEPGSRPLAALIPDRLNLLIFQLQFINLPEAPCH